MRIPTALSQKMSSEVLKYAISGGFGALIQVLLTTILVTRFSLHYSLAAILAFIVSLILSFLLQHSWTFAGRDKANNLSTMTFWYTAISVFGVGLNIMLLFILINLLHLAILPADTVAIVVVSITNYILNSKITFRESRL